MATRSIQTIDGTLTGTTTSNQSRSGSNGYKEIRGTSPELQNGSLTIKCSLVSYPEHSFLRENSYATAVSVFQA